MSNLEVVIDPDIEAAAIYFSHGYSAQAISFGDDVNVDLSQDGEITAVEFLYFGKLNYTATELRALNNAPQRVIEAVIDAQQALAEHLAKATTN